MAAKKAVAKETHMERDLKGTRAHGLQRKNSKKYDVALLAVDSANSPSKIAVVVNLLKAARKSGDHRATYALGTWHFHGKLFKKDEKKGFLLMLEAADNFIPDACYDVAVSYELGKGVRKNTQKAVVYYFRAMMLGEKQAITEVGRLFYWGIGVQEHRGIAKELLNFQEEKT